MFGATGWIFRIDKGVVLKDARDNGNQKERTIYDVFEAQEHTSPIIMHTFFRQGDAIFMPFKPGGCVRLRL
jgi:hypothetical protein